MGKKEFKAYICRPFCQFFRDGQKEGMACRGAHIVALLIKRNYLKLENLPLSGKDPRLWKQHDPKLEKNICGFCPFYPEDCDFQSLNRPEDSEPCGGYILICLLLEKDIIHIYDIEKIADE